MTKRIRLSPLLAINPASCVIYRLQSGDKRDVYRRTLRSLDAAFCAAPVSFRYETQSCDASKKLPDLQHLGLTNYRTCTCCIALRKGIVRFREVRTQFWGWFRIMPMRGSTLTKERYCAHIPSVIDKQSRRACQKPP